MECLCIYCSVCFLCNIISFNHDQTTPAQHVSSPTHCSKSSNNSFINKNFTITIKVRMQVLLRRESRRGGVMLKNRCRYFFDGKKTRFSKMQMALGGEQAGTCVFLFLSFVDDSERKRRFRSSTLVERKIGILLNWTRTCIYILCISCIRSGENSWVRIYFTYFVLAILTRSFYADEF